MAVKISKADRMSTNDFLSEAAKMKQLNHPHIARLVGLCTVGAPIMIIIEFAVRLLVRDKDTNQ